MSKRDMSDREIIIYLARAVDEAIMRIQDGSWDGRRRGVDALCDVMGGFKVLYERNCADGPGDYLDRHLRSWRKPMIV